MYWPTVEAIFQTKNDVFGSKKIMKQIIKTMDFIPESEVR
jgi:hypothetical protein